SFGLQRQGEDEKKAEQEMAGGCSDSRCGGKGKGAVHPLARSRPRLLWQTGSICLGFRLAARALNNHPGHCGSGKVFGSFFLFKLFQVIAAIRTIKSKTANVATMERDTRRRLVLLQTLLTHDFDELAQAFPQWDLRIRQLGRGPFRLTTYAPEDGAPAGECAV